MIVMKNKKEYECCILGAGPAGLAAANELINNNVNNIVLIEKNALVGGLSRTEVKEKYRFDIGPHRFFTKNQMINNLWHDMLGNDFMPIDRLTRIYYKNKFFSYPIKAFDTFIKLGPVDSLQALYSFSLTKFNPRKENAESFEQWITQKFGSKLYETFFKTYTEKVWGIPCNRIGAEWAAQRIKGLDIIQVLKSAFHLNSSNNIKTLVEQFDYPILGAGQMYSAFADKITDHGAEIRLCTSVDKIIAKDNEIISIEVSDTSGNVEKITSKSFFSSIPLTHFFHKLNDKPSPQISNAVESLYYREHISVDLLIDGNNIFPDQWIYIHSADVKMARIANYNNFSNAMVNYEKKTALSVEYFAFQSEELWQMNDNELIQLAVDELDHLKLIDKRKVLKSWVVRETESYPTYYLGFNEPYELLKKEISRYKNLYPIGRGGMYKYNNQDHSILSGILAAQNYLKLTDYPHDLWSINVDAEYLESAKRN
jgi:protoporphyrinogen oxidase